VSEPEEFTHDYVTGYRDGMSRASQIVNSLRDSNPPVSKDVDRHLHYVAKKLKEGASAAMAIGIAQHAEAPLPPPAMFDKVRVTSPYCGHLGVGTLIKLAGERGAQDEWIITASVAFDQTTWVGPISAVVPA
jgi:hypothetical protein